MPAEVKIDDTVILQADVGGKFPAFPSWQHVYVPEVDEIYFRALDIYAESVQEPELQEGDTDWRGDVEDPSDNILWIATHVIIPL
jgi:hypothetical protein